MPPSKRNGCVILYDVKTNPEFAKKAKQCLLNICATKWFLNSKDELKLVLLNTKESNNILHSKYGKSPHIYEATSDIIYYDPKLIIRHIQDVETAEADWLVGLLTAIEILREDFVNSKGITTLQLLFITDFSTPVQKKERRMEMIISSLNSLNIYFYVLGPRSKISSTLTSFEDIEKWSKNLDYIEGESENPNLEIIKQIVKGSNHGLVCDLKLGEILFRSYVKPNSSQPWKVPLTIGNSLAMSCSTSRFIKKVEAPRFIPYKTIPEWHLIDDLLQEVPYTNVIAGVYLYNQFVPLPPDVLKDFKCNEPRSFKIIGFTLQKNVLEFYLRGDGSNLVIGDNSNCFQLLLHQLAKEEKCIIAKRIYMQNCKPKLVALLPNVKDNLFILAELPYKDNISAEFIENDIDKAPKVPETNIKDGIYDYLEKLDITHPNNCNRDGSALVPLGHSLMDTIHPNIIAKRCLQEYMGTNVNYQEIQIDFPVSIDTTTYKDYIEKHETKEEA